MPPRELLLDPEIASMEKGLTRRLHHAIEVLSPLFVAKPNKDFPRFEVDNKLIGTSYNPALNRVRTSRYGFPIPDSEIGEEAGHYLHFGVNPLFGKYSDQEGLLLRQLIECVGRFSGLVYAEFFGEDINPTKDLQDDLKQSHEIPYILAERLFARHGSSFLFQLSRMKSQEFRELLNNTGGQNGFSSN